MSIEKCKDFVKDGYGTWDDTSKPTTYANMYDFMKNQNNIVMNLARGIWQPSTSYVVGTIIRSPSLPAGCVATCTTAGTSGTTEPKWTAYGTTVTDGSCKWKVNTDSQDTMVSERDKAIKSAVEATKSDVANTYATKSYVDAVNTTVTEMKEKYIFRFETFPKAQLTRSQSNSIRVYSPVPQGYERMAVMAYCNGSPTAFLPDLSAYGRKTEENMELWMQGVNDVNNMDSIYNEIIQLGVFTIFVKKE